MKKKLLSFVLVVSILVSAICGNTTNVNAAYSEEKKFSMKQCISYAKEAPMLSNIRLFHDNHGYYAVYDYNGRVECFLGKKNETMYFSDFAKKLGGTTTRNVKDFKVTKTENELKKLAFGALIAYICTQAGCPWYAAYLIGVAGDKSTEKLLRSPGKYRMTTIVTSVKAYDRASESYMETYYFHTVAKLEKYDSSTKKWKKIWNISNPEFFV